MSSSLIGVAQDAVHRRRGALPFVDLGLELSAAFGGDAVVARAAVVLARPPFRANPAAAQHRLEGGVDRALIDVEDVARDLAQPEREAPAVHRLDGQQLEGEHLERATEPFRARVVLAGDWHWTCR